MPVNKILQKVTDELQHLPFVKAVVLGGSRATGTATGNSDIDIGIYYDGIDYAALNNAAKRLEPNVWTMNTAAALSAMKANGGNGLTAEAG